MVERFKDLKVQLYGRSDVSTPNTTRVGNQRQQASADVDFSRIGQGAAGSTVDPETGSRTFPDGSPYKVNVHHHALVFSCGGEQFSLVALNNTGDQEASSVLVAGLIEEHLPHCL